MDSDRGGPAREDPELPLDAGDADDEPPPKEQGSPKGSPPAVEGTGEPEPPAAPDPSPLTELERLFQEAFRRARAGDLSGAARGYREVLSLDPGHVRARNNLAVLLDRSGDHEVAVQHFRTALEVEPENPELLSNLGAALGAMGRFDDAERELRRALRLNPTGIDVRVNLGILYLRRGLSEQAEGHLRWVCEQDANHASAHYHRGEALSILGRLDEGLRVVERALELQPGNPKAFKLMGILYDKKGEPELASAMYQKARKAGAR